MEDVGTIAFMGSMWVETLHCLQMMLQAKFQLSSISIGRIPFGWSTTITALLQILIERLQMPSIHP